MSIPLPDGSLWDVTPTPGEGDVPQPVPSGEPASTTSRPVLAVMQSPPDAALLRYEGSWRHAVVATTLDPYLLDNLQRSLGGNVVGVVVVQE